MNHKKAIRRKRIAAKAFVDSFFFGNGRITFKNVTMKMPEEIRSERVRMTKSYCREMGRLMHDCATTINHYHLSHGP